MFHIYDKTEDVTHEIKINTHDSYCELKSAIIKKASLADYKHRQLYVHIPYCFFHCNFCVYRGDLLKSKKQISEYCELFKREILHLKPLFNGTTFQSVFIGGGTVTVLGEDQLEELIASLRESFNFDMSKSEFTVELAPHGLSDRKIEVLRPSGVNRVSLGIQSLDVDLLKSMNRPAITEAKIKKIISSINGHSFSDFNVDLMVGVNGRSLENLYSDFRKLSDWGVESIMVYINMEDYRGSYTINKNLKNIELLEQLYERVSGEYNLNNGEGVNEYNRFRLRKKESAPIFDNRYSTNFKGDDTFCLGLGRQAKSWTNEMVFYYS
ncbi:radical SAM protein [Pseudomonas sp. P8_241]|uniref:radical SAM protein n=1 Tax=Pseudomonas sp. P8_241 TaxID=3043445 RepID=UPI002A36882E|nr:radical SAM protein [Pseudomonas sp. P8_241]WPN47861.1 radical SAM protein [Pseudomonas sp. P8_241]